MKLYSLPLILVAFILLPSQVIHAETDDTRRPTWIERIFGAKDPSEVNEAKQSEQAEVKAEEAKAEREEAKEKNKGAKENRKFTEEEREVLESWQQGNANWKKSKKPLPPGLQKKVARGGELPPGWKKKLEVGAVLDPEVDAQASSLPEEILRRLPESEAGTEILRVGDEIIRVIENSREIVDILGGIGEPEPVED